MKISAARRNLVQSYPVLWHVLTIYIKPAGGCRQCEVHRQHTQCCHNSSGLPRWYRQICTQLGSNDESRIHKYMHRHNVCNCLHLEIQLFVAVVSGWKTRGMILIQSPAEIVSRGSASVEVLLFCLYWELGTNQSSGFLNGWSEIYLARINQHCPQVLISVFLDLLILLDNWRGRGEGCR